MRTSRLPQVVGTVLALAATMYFSNRAASLIAFHIAAALIVGVAFITRSLLRDALTRSLYANKKTLLFVVIALVSVSWLVLQVVRLLDMKNWINPLILVVAIAAFMGFVLVQDEELPIETRLLRSIDGLILTFVVLGLEWFTLIETANFTPFLLLANILVSLPFVSALLFVTYSQKIELLWSVLGAFLACGFMLELLNLNGEIPAYWDLVAIGALLSLSLAMVSRRTEKSPSPLLPLLPYALGVVVIILGVMHALLANMTRTDFAVLAAVGVSLIARQAYALVEQRQLLNKLSQHENQLRHLAMHDVLTSLPNRTLFQDRLEHAVAMRQRNGGDLSLVYIDINDFKKVNDEYGHVFGDELLIHVAQRLATWVRPSDTVARLGGDEFVVLMESTSEGALRVAERLAAELKNPYQIAGRTLSTSASVGLYTCSDWQGSVKEISERIVNRADRAMYQAKGEKREVVVAH